MEKVFVVSISKHCESRVYAAEEDRIVPRMTNGVLRIFESKDDAKKNTLKHSIMKVRLIMRL